MHLEPFLKDVVNTTQEFIDAIADDDDHDNLCDDANDYLDLIKKQWEQFLSLEAEIEKKLSVIEQKNVSGLEADPSEKKCVVTCNDLISSVPATSSVKGNTIASNKEING